MRCFSSLIVAHPLTDGATELIRLNRLAYDSLDQRLCVNLTEIGLVGLPLLNQSQLEDLSAIRSNF